MARLLIIDDEIFIRETVALMLECDDHTVFEASDGEQGTAAFRQLSPDIVISDILMPNKDGFETIMDLRHIEPDVKIIAMSGGRQMQNTDLNEIAQLLGANVFIKKPFAFDVLRGAVNACLETAGAAGQAT